jgi:hypothetical protein
MGPVTSHSVECDTASPAAVSGRRVSGGAWGLAPSPGWLSARAGKP